MEAAPPAAVPAIRNASRLSGPYTVGAWAGNIVWQTNGTGAMPAGTFDEVDPLLTPLANGIFRPQLGSPAINSAVGDYPAVVLDMDGQPRPAAKDRGADELSLAPPTATFLTPEVLLFLINSWL